ncbi:MAG: hypothetical protein JST21_13860 [Bacteroidetes bacterium]|nr:hypothetical protein [Bacteroidota bacterium]
MKIPTIKSIRENIAIKDLLFTGAPTAGTYTGYLNGYLNEILPQWLIVNPWLTLGITILLFIIVIIILYYFNNEAHKKSLAEVLATGYFLNFSGKLTTLLKQENEITFLRSSGPLTVPSSKIKLDILLPTSKDAMEETASGIEQTSEIAYIGNRSFTEPNLWMRIKENVEDGSVSIIEFPRTLFALPHYLSTEYKQGNSKKIHQAFNNKFRQLIADNPDKRPPAGRFELKEIQ